MKPNLKERNKKESWRPVAYCLRLKIQQSIYMYSIYIQVWKDSHNKISFNSHINTLYIRNTIYTTHAYTHSPASKRLNQNIRIGIRGVQSVAPLIMYFTQSINFRSSHVPYLYTNCIYTAIYFYIQVFIRTSCQCLCVKLSYTYYASLPLCRALMLQLRYGFVYTTRIWWTQNKL